MRVEKPTWKSLLAVFDDEHRDTPEPEIIFVVPVSRWPEGTAAPRQAMD